MAGAGYKLFNTGDVLTAAQVNTYLQEQVVMVFNDATARTTALSGVLAEGMVSYLKSTKVVEIYNGTAWASLDDPNAIQNTIVDAKGDLISASANDVPARLAVGNNGETLVADSSATTGLRWQGNYAAGKNRIINGAMLIDQRNSASSAITINTAASTYSVDRWLGFGQATDGVFTLAQDTSAPVGFTKSLKATVTTADASIAATQIYVVSQNIEGLQVADFDFGTANAKTVTLSFWVRSSLTGTFGGSIRNGAADRSYPFTYSISVADTWEKKSVTLVGDTTGTWLKDTGIGLRVTFSLGAGVDRVGTAGAWNGNNNAGATGQTQVISTLNATWYVSGVQLEIGSVGTAFTNAGGTFAGELAACQRYYYRTGSNSAFQPFAFGSASATTNTYIGVQFPVAMRVPPTVLDYANVSLQDGAGGNVATTGITINSAGTLYTWVNAAAASGLTQFRPYFIAANNSTSAYFGFGAEL